MNRNIRMGLVGLALTVAATGAYAGAHGKGFTDTAKVIWAEPIYELVEVSRPVQECWTEEVVHRGSSGRSYTGTILGGVVGGVIGNQFGGGSGKKAMTVAGTLLGASVGHELSQSRRHRPRIITEEFCEMVDRYEQQEQLVGYRVKYRYKGKTFFTTTREHPGKHIRVRVKVSPT